MTDEFGGIPVEETQVTRDEFGGIAVDQPAVPGMKKLGAELKPNDPGIAHGLYESTIGPLAEFGAGLRDDPVKAIGGLATGLNRAAILEPWEYAKKTGSALVRGDVMGAVRNAPGMVPIFGPAAENVADMAESGQPRRAIGNAIGLVGTAALPSAAKAIVPPIAKAAKTAAIEVAGRTTGVGPAVLRRAAEQPSAELTNAMRGGLTEVELVKNFQGALQNVKDARGAAYQKQLRTLPMSGPGTDLDLSPVRAEVGSQLKKFNIKVTPKGELDFSRSTIRDASAQNDVRSVYNDVMGWGAQPGDKSPLMVDTLKRRVDDAYSPSSSARAIVQSVKDSTRTLLEDNVPGYTEMTKGYAEASRFLDQLSDLSLESKNPGTAVRKLTTLLNQNNGYRQALAEHLSQFTPEDLQGQLAGMSLHRWTPRGIVGAGSGVGLLYAVATHVLTPQAAIAVAASSPRMMGELLTAFAKIPKPSISAGVGKAIQIGVPVGPALYSPKAQRKPRPSPDGLMTPEPVDNFVPERQFQNELLTPPPVQ